MLTSKNAVNLFISDKANISFHCHDYIELLMIVSGTCNVFIEGIQYHANADDIFLFNSNQIHAYQSDKPCIHITCQIDISQLNLHLTKQNFFSVNSVASSSDNKYTVLRSLLSELVLIQNIEDNNAKSLSFIYQIMSELILNFTESDSETSHPVLNANKNTPEKTDILLRYIVDHYSEMLTLNFLATKFNYSVPYLSSLFKKKLHMTFTEYYNTIRLEHAITNLLNTSDSIDVIAYNNGFSDTRTFVRVFKNKYGSNPSTYRKAYHESTAFVSPLASPDNFFHPSLGKMIYEKKLASYVIQNDSPFHSNSTVSTDPTIYIDCGTSFYDSTQIKNNYPFHKICYVTDFHQLLEETTILQLNDLQKNNQFDYIAFGLDALLDSLHPDIECSDSKYYTFNKIISTISELKLTPMFSFIVNHSFFAIVNSGDENTGINSNQNYLHTLFTKLHEFCRYIIQKYGMDTVQNWVFRTWFRSLNTTGNNDCNDSKLFFQLYKSFYQTIKEVSPKFCVGLHLLLAEHIFRDVTTNDIFDYCCNTQTLPDIIFFEYTERTIVNSYSENSPDYFSKFIDSVNQFVEDFHLSSKKIYIMDSHLTAARLNPVNDSCFKSCYIMRNILRSIDKHASAGSWQLSDTVSHASTLFHGGRGIYTYNSIPKPFYYSFTFLSKLGHEIIDNQEGWIVTKENNRITIIFYNYDFYKQATATPGGQSRISPFQTMEKTYFTLKIDHIPFSHFIMRQSALHQSHGSSFDAWTEINRYGKSKANDGTYYDFLQNIRPDLKMFSGKINNGIINIDALLEPLEIRLFEIDLL